MMKTATDAFRDQVDENRAGAMVDGVRLAAQMARELAALIEGGQLAAVAPAEELKRLAAELETAIEEFNAEEAKAIAREAPTHSPRGFPLTLDEGRHRGPPLADIAVLRHVRWLEMTERHTQEWDQQTGRAIAQGWAEIAPGIMRPDQRGRVWFRVKMTRNGLEAMATLEAAG